MKLVSTLVTVYAALLAACGLALVFAPTEVGALVSAGPGAEAGLLQVIGAAFVGFATANWTARTSVLGGIYGRAVVAGNQAFAFVGALCLVGSVPEAPGVAYWGMVAVLGFGAVLFSWLLFGGGRIVADDA